MLLLNYAGYIEPIFTYDKDETLIYLYKFDTIYTFYVTGLYTQNNVPDIFLSVLDGIILLQLSNIHNLKT